MSEQPPWAPPPTGQPSAPRKAWPRRHPVWTVISGLAGLFIVLVVAAAVSLPAPATAGHGTSASTAPAPAQPAAAPVPAPSADVAGTGTCDVSLSDALYGQNYLVASLDVTNSGGAAAVVRLTVRWPLSGVPDHVTRHRVIHLAAGGERHVGLQVPASIDEVGRFQDVQLATDGDPCDYSLEVVG